MIWTDLPVDGRVWLCSLQKYTKTLLRLHSSRKSVTARFAMWNPGNWHENQIEIQSKTLVNPSNIEHTHRTGSLAVSQGVLYFDYRTHVPREAEQSQIAFTVMK